VVALNESLQLVMLEVTATVEVVNFKIPTIMQQMLDLLQVVQRLQLLNERNKQIP